MKTKQIDAALKALRAKAYKLSLETNQAQFWVQLPVLHHFVPSKSLVKMREMEEARQTIKFVSSFVEDEDLDDTTFVNAVVNLIDYQKQAALERVSFLKDMKGLPTGCFAAEHDGFDFGQDPRLPYYVKFALICFDNGLKEEGRQLLELENGSPSFPL